MENIGQVTVDLSGSLAFTKDLCDKLGLVPGEQLVVARKQNGEVALTPLGNASDEPVMSKEQGSASVEAGEMKLVNKDGVLVFTLEDGNALPDVLTEWLNDPVKYDRELRMRELMKGCGLESFT